MEHPTPAAEAVTRRLAIRTSDGGTIAGELVRTRDARGGIVLTLRALGTAGEAVRA